MQEMTPPSAAELKTARVMLNMSQVAFAEALSTSRRNVENWETDKAEPPAFLRLAIAALFAGLEPWKP